ncbi:MAG: hypothetical protein QM703_02315 [Gemmatales bacterium]
MPAARPASNSPGSSPAAATSPGDGVVVQRCEPVTCPGTGREEGDERRRRLVGRRGDRPQLGHVAQGEEQVHRRAVEAVDVVDDHGDAGRPVRAVAQFVGQFGEAVGVADPEDRAVRFPCDGELGEQA